MATAKANQFASTPDEMRSLRQWVGWKVEVRENKPTKVPYNPRTGGKAVSTNPKTWGSFDQAAAFYEANEDCAGVGFVFHEGDGFCGVDLDKCLNDDGTLKPWAVSFVACLDSYTEVTPSGSGLHVILWAKMADGSRHKVLYQDGAVEAYDRGRFFTMTGNRWPGSPAFPAPRQEQLDQFCEAVFPKKAAPKPAARPAQPVNLDDRALLDKMFASKHGPEIERLWKGDKSAHGEDDSAADLALCNHLAFWCNRDETRMDALFRQSGLYREKWEREDYRSATLGKAIAECGEGYQPGMARAPDRDDSEAPPERGSFDAIHETTRTVNELRREEERMDAAPRRGKKPAKEKPEIYTAADLQTMQFPEMKWVIPGILSEGLCLLAGPPKSAKSALALQTAIATAAGGRALGKFQVEQGEVLYVALEDTKRRMKDRMQKVLSSAKAPAGLYFAHRWPKLGNGAEEEIMEWIEKRSEARLVILDTFGRSRGPRKPNGNTYDEDVATLDPVQRLAQDRRVCVLLLHHTNKRVDSEDPFHAISGSEGIAGGTDTNLILRKPRAEKRGTLFVTGKDVDEVKYEVEFDGLTMTWTFVGRSDEGPKTSDQSALLALIASLGRPVTAKEVHAAMVELGSKRSYSSVKGMMWRMFQDGQLVLQDAGRYGLPPKH